MRPLAALNAIIFGSATAIGFGLTATLVVFFVLRNEHEPLAGELPTLLRSCVLFWILAAVAGSSLYATLKERSWRTWSQVAMWCCVALTVAYYWPK